MKRYENILIFIFFIFFLNCNQNQYVSYYSSGLLGDRLLQYSIAKWISWKFNIPLLYQPFPFSDLFVLHEKEYCNESLLKKYKNIIKLTNFSYDSFQQDGLYNVTTHCYDKEWDYNNLIDTFIITQYLLPINSAARKTGRVIIDKYHEDQIICEERTVFDYLFIASRKHQDFLSILREFISYRQKIKYFLPRKDKISVAIHIRCSEKLEPIVKYCNEISLRVPPLDFYVDQLKRLSNFLDNAPLFVYIFTNHSDPLTLLHEIKSNFVEFNNITFASRTKNDQKDTFIEDLFLMSKFDCLIRPNSAFSKIAQLIGDHKIILYPKNGIWKDMKLYIDKIGMIVIGKNL